MQQEVRINLLGSFAIRCDGQSFDTITAKSKKGTALMEFLILQRGRVVPLHRIIHELDGNSRNTNPENAVKTMISRFRVLLNSISPGLGGCIVSSPGAYRWVCQPNVSVDVQEFLDLIDLAKKNISPAEKEAVYQRVLDVYQGDLFRVSNYMSATLHESILHRDYLSVVYAYIDFLKEREAYQEICQVCHRAISIDHTDEQLRLELMRALVQLHRTQDAAGEAGLSLKDLPMQGAALNEITKAGSLQKARIAKRLNLNLDSIRAELMQNDSVQKGPFFCDYSTFKIIYEIQTRNLERLGSGMFLSVIMIGGEDETLDSVTRESAIAGLTEILRKNLRRGDIVTRFSSDVMAMLLPAVSYGTGVVVMDRIEYMFYQAFPKKDIPFYYRIIPLGEHASTFYEPQEIMQKGEAE